jgi:hypothetical protein
VQVSGLNRYQQREGAECSRSIVSRQWQGLLWGASLVIPAAISAVVRPVWAGAAAGGLGRVPLLRRLMVVRDAMPGGVTILRPGWPFDWLHAFLHMGHGERVPCAGRQSSGS